MMTDEQINSAITAACAALPWTLEYRATRCQAEDAGAPSLDYCGHLPTMHAVESALRAFPERWGRYIVFLASDLQEKRGGVYWAAPSRDRASAFLKLVSEQCCGR